MQPGDRITSEGLKRLSDDAVQRSRAAQKSFERSQRRLSSLELVLAARGISAPAGRSCGSAGEPGRLYLPLQPLEGTSRQGPLVATSPVGSRPIEFASEAVGSFPELLSPGRIVAGTSSELRASLAAPTSRRVSEILLPAIAGQTEMTLYFESGPRRFQSRQTRLWRLPGRPRFTGEIVMRSETISRIAGEPVYGAAAPYLFDEDLPPDTASGTARATIPVGAGPASVPAGVPISVERVRLHPTGQEVGFELLADGSSTGGTATTSKNSRLEIEAELTGRQFASLLEVEYRL